MGMIMDTLVKKATAIKKLAKIAMAKEALQKQAIGLGGAAAIGAGVGLGGGALLGGAGGAAHHVVAPKDDENIVGATARGMGRGAMYGLPVGIAAGVGGGALVNKAADFLSKLKSSFMAGMKGMPKV